MNFLTNWLDSLFILLIKFFALPPLTVLRMQGKFGGSIIYYLNLKSVRIARINIQHCFPKLQKAQQEKYIKQSMQHSITSILEICKLFSKSPAYAQRLILAEENKAYAQKVYDKAQGLLLLIPHLGNWEIFSFYQALLDDKTVLYRKLSKFPKLDNFIYQKRARCNAKFYHADKIGIRRAFDNLRHQGITVLLADQGSISSSTKFANFYGVPKPTSMLPYKLIQKTNCQVLFAYAKRVKGGFHIVFKAPPAAIYDHDHAIAQTALNQGIESCINDCIPQYWWEYKRFRNLPSLRNVYGEL